ncbi:MAG TPA: carbohydrate ABC transporter permease [Chloroflexi bacterium]|jgi:ABC-type glycerol-3-phosphate transport system permease component|nr:carbohydrate ABC transporter permease [Chloroflexota bacterium]HPO57249.1 carbohydrate ABC transporter permease [Anaerolineaceae bacterium]
MKVKKFTAMDILRQTIIMAVLIVMLFPIYWMIVTSLKPTNLILMNPPVFTFKPTLEHYIYAFEQANFALYIRNTLLAAIFSTIIVVVAGSLASYGFARYNVGGGNLMFFILTTRMMPAIAVVLPFFVIFRTAGNSAIGQFFHLGMDRIGTLVVCYTIFNLPFAIWLMHSFFQDIPVELEDSARLDGYSRIKVFFKVVLPLAAPGIAVTAIFCLLFSWNEYLFASILTRDMAKTITVGVGDFWTQRGILWGPLSAAATVCVMPMIAFALLLQKWIVRGLTFGAVRG